MDRNSLQVLRFDFLLLIQTNYKTGENFDNNRKDFRYFDDVIVIVSFFPRLSINEFINNARREKKFEKKTFGDTAQRKSSLLGVSEQILCEFIADNRNRLRRVEKAGVLLVHYKPFDKAKH